MAIIMLLGSVIPTLAATIPAPEGKNDGYSTIEIDKGILTLKLDSEKLYEVLRDGEITRDELQKILPKEIVDTLDGGDNVDINTLVSLVRNYVTTDDLFEIFDMIPTEVIFEYFDLRVFTDIISIEELLDIVPVDEIMEDISVEDVEQLIENGDNTWKYILIDAVIERVTDSEFIKKVLTEGSDELVDAAVAVISNELEKERAAGIHTADGSLYNAILDLVGNSVIDILFDDKTIIKDGKTAEDLVTEIVESPNTLDNILANKTVLDKIKHYLENHEGLEDFVADEEVRKVLGDSGQIHDFLSDRVGYDKLIREELKLNFSALAQAYNIDYNTLEKKGLLDGINKADLDRYKGYKEGELLDTMLKEGKISYETLEKEFDFSVSTLMGKKLLTHAQIADVVFNHWHELVSDDELLEHILTSVGLHKIYVHFDHGHEMIEDVFGGYRGMIDYEIVNAEDVIDALGGYGRIIDAILEEGNQDTLLVEAVKKIDYETWAKGIGFANIVDLVGGYGEVFSWYSFDALWDIGIAVGRRNILDILKESGAINKLFARPVVSQVIDLVLSKRDQIKDIVPDLVDSFTSMAAQENLIVTLNDTIVYKYGDMYLQAIVTELLQQIPDAEDIITMKSGDVLSELVLRTVIRGRDVQLGIVITLEGDMTNLKEIAKKNRDDFRLDVSDDLDIETEIATTAVFTELYEKALLSDRVSAKIKTKLLALPTMTVSEAIDLFESIDDEDIKKFAEEIAEKLDDIKSDIYRKIDNKFGSNIPGSGYAKKKVDKVLKAFSDGAELCKLKDKLVTLMEISEGEGGNRKISDYYSGSSIFNIEGDFSIDLYEKLSVFVDIPDKLYVLFNNDMTLSGTLDMKLTVNDLYKIEVYDTSENIQEFFLPAGVPLNILNKYADIDYVFDADEYMPASDCVFGEYYTIHFHDDSGVTSVRYSETVPLVIPTVTERAGYSARWEDFVAFSEKELHVNAIYTPDDYKISYYFGGEWIDFDFTVTVETRELELPVLYKNGYTHYGWFVDIDGDGVFGAEDGDFYLIKKASRTFKLTKDAKTETYQLPADKSFPADSENVKLVPEFDLVEHKITFYALNASGNYYRFGNPQTFSIVDRTVDIPTDKPKHHDMRYRFVFWALDTDGDGEGDTPLTSTTELPLGADLSVYAVYEKYIYKATFVDVNGNVYKTISFSIDDSEIKNAPKVPTVTGYDNGEWYVDNGDGTYTKLSEYTPTAKDITVCPKYDIIEYTASFYDKNGELLTTLTFTVNDSKLKNIPKVPEVEGYKNGEWQVYRPGSTIPLKYYTLGTENIDIYPKYEPIEYTATFYDINNQKMDEEFFTIEYETLRGVPRVPAVPGYTNGVWCVKVDDEYIPIEDYKLPAKDIEVYARYEIINYTATFVIGSEIISTINFTVKDKKLENPVIADKYNKVGYLVDWESYKLGTEDIVINAVYTPIIYKATFLDINGKVYKELTFTVEDSELYVVPEVPAVAGFRNSKWYVKLDSGDVLLSEYTLGTSNITVYAKYEITKFNATFVADGKTVGVFTFFYGDKYINEPEVPEKYGYIGKWEEYSLTANDIVINAIYVEGGDWPTVEPPTDDENKSYLIWLILFIIFVICLVIMLLTKKREEPVIPEPEPEPIVIPEPEPEPVVEEIFPIVETIDVETADALMSDEKAVEVLEEIPGAGVGMKAIININDINNAYSAGDVVDIDSLKEKKLISKKAGRIKVLADGHLDKPLKIYAESFSLQAIKMITLTGGRAIKRK